MPTVLACKLPHGMVIDHGGQTINVNGANANADPLNPMANGAAFDTETTTGGYGLTTLTADQAAAFEDWSGHALYKRNGEGTPIKDNGMLDEPFLPLTNGSLLSFKSEADARKEVRNLSNVETGFDGLDGDAETKKAASGSALQEVGKQKD